MLYEMYLRFLHLSKNATKQSKQQETTRYCELELRTDTMQKVAKNAKAASIKINSMFWTKVMFVFYLLSHLDKHGSSYRG